MDAVDPALLEAIRAAPDDDSPRLVWADAVGGERGELVVLQCDLARGGLTSAEAGARRRRERELLAKHGPSWAGLGELVEDARFRRGFVDAVTVYASRFVARAAELALAAPLVRSLRVLGLEGMIAYERDPMASLGDITAMRTRDLLEALEAYPAIDRLALVDARLEWTDGDPVLGTIESAGYEGRADEVAPLLVDTGALGRLRALALGGCGLTAEGAHALVASHQLGGLEALAIDDSPLGSDAVAALVRACPRLDALEVDAAYVLGDWPLPALDALSLRTFQRATLPALAGGPCAASLRRLRLRLASGMLEDDLAALARLPRLVALELEYAQLAGPVTPTASQPPAAQLARSTLPALRELRITEPLWPDDLVAIARTFGAQLELLHVAPSTDATTLAQLEALVAGDVVATELPPRYI